MVSARRFLVSSAAVSALLVAGAATLSRASGDKAHEFGTRIDAKYVVRVRIAEQVTAYAVDLQYAFAGRPTVDLSTLGTVPAKGSLRFITTEPELVFRDKPGGAVLLKYVPEETEHSTGKPALYPVPRQSSFPKDHIAFSWPAARSLAQRADTVLVRHFQYLPRKGQGRNTLLTTFATLPAQRLPKGIVGRVALLISYPEHPRTDSFEVHVQSLVLEGKTASDVLTPARNEQVRAEADRFVAELVRQLREESAS